ncbi:MAG: ATP-dependent DNA helicase RecG, partial [Muribaculaceae bacterium]|nr:ATP-dependent DNA helicase RecG [Muribaculaceae bacterium]
MAFLETDIKYLKGVGEKRAKLMESELEISTFGDLMFTFPYRYVDTSRFYKISEFTGEMPMVQVLGRFVSFSTEGEGMRQRLKATFFDGKRYMEVVWFSKINFFKTAYVPGKFYVLFGKPTQYRDVWQMAHPEVNAYDEAKPPTGFRGVYSIPDKLRKRGHSSRLVSDLIKNLFENPKVREIPETIPAEVLSRFNMMPLLESLFNLHFPQSPDKLQKARERMKFEELFYLQLHILRYSRERGRKIRGHILPRIGECFNNYYSNHIPFELTGAQKRVLKEIRNDMRTGRQMNRLLQGDVGSGKTMVAFMSMLMAIDNGFQTAIMAPTEILATQHY